jgi:hypothetical protein
MNKKQVSAFTPLRVSLMIFIIIVNIAAFAAFFFPDTSWSEGVGLFATVFILMCVFVQLLELIWLYSFKKQQDNLSIRSSYQKAINIYLILFPLGFLMVYLVLA